MTYLNPERMTVERQRRVEAARDALRAWRQEAASTGTAQPCPCCGSTNLRRVPVYATGSGPYVIDCGDCGTTLAW